MNSEKAFAFAFDSVIPLGDKLRVRKLRNQCVGLTDTDLLNIPEETTRVALRRFGFTPAIVERFFEPFFGGIFLERNLTTSARWFRWLFGIFAEGFAAVPELGMEQIPQQMAAKLPDGVLQLNARVNAIQQTSAGWRVETESAGAFTSSHLTMAAREPEAKQLLANVRKPGPAPARTWNRTTTLYYAASTAPIEEPVIVLNGDGPTSGPVNHLAVMTTVSPAYAPPGAHLICANIVGQAPENDHAMEVLEAEVRVQMRRWFGDQVNQWGVLAGYPIAHALPLQSTFQPNRTTPLDSGMAVCGDYLTSASIQGALLSGAAAANTLLEHDKKSSR